MKGMLVAAITAGVMLSSGCAPTVSTRALTGSFPPSPVERGDVLVYVEGDSIPEHTRLATLTAQAGRTEFDDKGRRPLRNALRKEAGSLGANAIIWSNPSYSFWRGLPTVATAVAIYVPSIVGGVPRLVGNPVSGVISGAVTTSQSVVVAEFEGRASADGDVLTIHSLPSPTITNPMVLPAGAWPQSYEYRLPADPQTFGRLIAFIDLDGDGKLDLPKEPVRRPVKSLPTCGSGEQHIYWGSVTVHGNTEYVVHCREDPSQSYSLDEIGRDGFNFRF